MTENEAIKGLMFLKEKLYNGIYADRLDCIDYAISALKEIKLYKDGKLCLVPKDVYSKQCNELDAYKEIGTVEECREAVEKQKPKEPKHSIKIYPVLDDNGAYVDAETTVYLLCPNCIGTVGVDDCCDNYCRECGQKIDKESKGE